MKHYKYFVSTEELNACTFNEIQSPTELFKFQIYKITNFNESKRTAKTNLNGSIIEDIRVNRKYKEDMLVAAYGRIKYDTNDDIVAIFNDIKSAKKYYINQVLSLAENIKNIYSRLK